MLLRAVSSPSQSLTRQIPPFVAARHLPPARGKSVKGRGLGKTGKFISSPEAPTLGELSSECETERASHLVSTLFIIKESA